MGSSEKLLKLKFKVIRYFKLFQIAQSSKSWFTISYKSNTKGEISHNFEEQTNEKD
jgi:hypothetical protein